MFNGRKSGDGIVVNESNVLPESENVKNFFVEGKCENSFRYFHSEILNIDKYPKVYEIVRNALKES